MSRGTVLVLDDEKNIVIVLTAILEKRGFRVVGFSDPEQALAELSKQTIDAVVTDLFMPEMNGIAFLKAARQQVPNIPVVVITAFGAVDTAVDAIKSGAFDYVTKPFEQSEISSVVEKAVSTRRLQMLEVIPGGRDMAEAPVVNDAMDLLLQGKGKKLASLAEVIERLAGLPSTVLILGETGSGKEILVEELHRRSPRAKQALVRLNCAALPAEDLDAELFGTEARSGRIEQAQGSTLFLDEFTLLPAPTQVRLVEYLDSGRVERRSDGAWIRVDARIVAASSADLAESVAQGRIRDTLYYALNVAPIQLPSLAERAEDFPELVSIFRKRLADKLGVVVPRFSSDCIEAMSRLPWPGNLRQLERVMERMVLSAVDRTELNAADIPEEIREVDMNSDLGLERFRDIVKRKTQTLERDLIEQALRTTGDNVTKAAEHLGMSRKGLQIKMKDLGFR